MTIEGGKQAPSFRAIYGKPEVVEHQVNQLMEEYTVLSYNWAVVKDELILSALLVHNRLILRLQLAQTRMGGGRIQ